MSGLLPIFLDLAGAEVVVTGSGPAATAAARRLAAHARSVRLVAPEAPAGTLPEGVTHVAALPSVEHLGDAALVFAADGTGRDAALVEAASRRGVPVVRGGGIGGTGGGAAWLGHAVQVHGIAVAVSTMGKSDELESRLAARLVDDVMPVDGRWAEILGGLRVKLEERFPDAERRTRIWQDILDSPVAALLAAGQDDEALELAERMAWGTG